MTYYALMFISNDGSEITGGRHKMRHIMNRRHVQKSYILRGKAAGAHCWRHEYS
jgi:hypothetical protein